jgi:undecaprenyl-diphosphatase
MVNMRISDREIRCKPNRIAIITAILCGLLAIALTIFISRSAFFPGDLAFTHFCQSLANPVLTALMKSVTYIFGDWRAVILTAICTVVIGVRIGKREGVVVALAGILSLFNYVFKLLIGRPRPSADLVSVMVHETNFSYPSSHAFFSILFLGFVIYIINKNYKSGPLKSIIVWLLGLLILVVGLTRVYLGVHWYSDMLAGFIFGGFFLSLLILGYERWRQWGKVKQ